MKVVALEQGFGDSCGHCGSTEQRWNELIPSNDQYVEIDRMKILAGSRPDKCGMILGSLENDAGTEYDRSWLLVPSRM